MTDIAVLGLEIRSDGVVVASDRLKRLTQEGKNAESATTKLSSATASLTNYIKMAAAAFGLYKLADLARESALLAARYQTLGVVMNTVGATAGYTNAQMGQFEKTLQKQGIAMVESRQALTMMAQAHLDLSKAGELGRVAQDAATIGGINSSEAFERMIAGIQKGETEILKTIGINVNFEQSYAKMALTLGKSRQELTETEKAQARMNIVLERGKDIAGVYDAAMGTAGKQLTSMKRYMDNLKVSIGSVFNDILIVGVQSFTGALKGANSEAEKLIQQNKLAEWGQGIVNVLAVIADAITIVGKGLYSMVSVGVAGFSQLYHAAESFSFAMIADFDGARNSFNEMLNDGVAWTAMMNDTWSNPTMFQDAAKAMYAQREANKEAEELKRKQLEQQQLLNGEVERERQEIEHKALLQQKSLDVSQDQAEVQKEVNQLVQQENEMRNRSILMTDRFGILQRQIDIERSQGLEQQAFEDQKILDLQKLKFDYSEKMLEYQEQLNTATIEEGEIIKRNMSLYDQMTSQAQQAIESRQLQQSAVQRSGSSTGYGSSWGYDENGNLLNPSQRMPSSANGGVTLSPLSSYVGMERINEAGDISGIFGAINDRIDKANTQAAFSWWFTANAERIQKEREAAAAEAERNRLIAIATTELNDDLSVRELELAGRSDEAALLKLSIEQTNEYNQAVEQGLRTDRLVAVQQAEYNKLLYNQALSKAIKDTRQFFDTIKSSIENMASAGATLVDSLRNAATSLRQASSDLYSGSASILSPEQQYQLSKTNLENLAQSAMSSGDAELYARIPAMVTSFLDQSRNYNASNTQYGLDFSWASELLNTSADAADTAATNAEAVMTAAERQQATLDAIHAALTTDNTAALPRLFAELSSDSGALASAVATTTASIDLVNSTTANGSTSLASWLSTVNSTTGAVNTSIDGVRTAVAPLSAINTSTAATNTYTSTYLPSINANTRVIKKVNEISWQSTVPNVYGQIGGGSTLTYEYYAKGGIANKPSIFGEAGPEAAVPLPDGRSIPVTLSGAADGYDRKLMQEVLDELRKLTRVQVAGNNGIIAPLQGMEKRLMGVENKARLAANQ